MLFKLVVACALGLLAHFVASAPEGPDVSHWDGAVDWKKVKAHGVSFAMVGAMYS